MLRNRNMATSRQNTDDAKDNDAKDNESAVKETIASRRLTKEAKAMRKNKSLQCIVQKVAPINPLKDMHNWEAWIIGPNGTPYEGGIYELSIQCPDNYPYDPPKIRFLTKIYHAHLCDNEDIKLNLMEDNWSPHFKLTHILYAIVECMSAGINECDALVASAAVEMRQNMQRFLRIAVEMNHQYAGGESLYGRGLEALKECNTLYLTHSIQSAVSECIYEYYGIGCADLIAELICQFNEYFPNFEPWMEYSRNMKAKGQCAATKFEGDSFKDQKLMKSIQVRISFSFRVSPYHRVLALKKRLKMEYGIDLTGMILEYHGFHLQDDDVLGDRGKASEKTLCFKPVVRRSSS